MTVNIFVLEDSLVNRLISYYDYLQMDRGHFNYKICIALGKNGQVA